MCLVCKEDVKMEYIDFSNQITINEIYGLSDYLNYCTYCGAIFIVTSNLGINETKEED